jgi:hypothetical protein
LVPGTVSERVPHGAQVLDNLPDSLAHCGNLERFILGVGDYLYLPRDVVHTFRNTYDEESRVISVVSPAGLEGYYQALADMPPGPKDIGTIKQIMADFGIMLQLPPEVS